MNHGAQVDFELTEEQAALREVSRGLLAVNCPPQLVRSLAAAGQDTDDKLWQRGAELGWTGLAVPEELDGAGQGVVELCLVAEELGRAAAPGPFLDSALTALALARARRRADLVSSLAAGEVKASLAHHGAVVGSYDGDELVLSGRATAVQAAASADWLLVTVAVGRGRRLVLLERARTAVEPRRTLDETRRWYDVVFDGVRVPAADTVSADEAEVQRLADAVNFDKVCAAGPSDGNAAGQHHHVVVFDQSRLPGGVKTGLHHAVRVIGDLDDDRMHSPDESQTLVGVPQIRGADDRCAGPVTRNDPGRAPGRRSRQNRRAVQVMRDVARRLPNRAGDGLPGIEAHLFIEYAAKVEG